MFRPHQAQLWHPRADGCAAHGRISGWGGLGGTDRRHSTNGPVDIPADVKMVHERASHHVAPKRRRGCCATAIASPGSK